MTLKELQDTEEKGKKALAALEAMAKEFAQSSGVAVKVEKELNLFATAKPCLVIKKEGLLGKKLFYFRNTINNPRQPSPVFVRIFDKQYEKQFLELLQKYQPKIEEAIRLRVQLHQEEKI